MQANLEPWRLPLGPRRDDRLPETPYVVGEVDGIPCGSNGVVDRDGDVGDEKSVRIHLAGRRAKANVTDAVQRPMTKRRRAGLLAVDQDLAAGPVEVPAEREVVPATRR